MITQTDVNQHFRFGEERIMDVCKTVDDDMLGHAEIAGMMMGALKVHAERRGKPLLECAIELAELIGEDE